MIHDGEGRRAGGRGSHHGQAAAFWLICVLLFSLLLYYNKAMVSFGYLKKDQQ
jgi:hypothetical protein